MLTIRAIEGGAGYAGRHLEHNDYYAENETVKGVWHGHGAEVLGLRGEVTETQFEALRQCHHPATGEFLRQRRSADRLAQDGTGQSKGRNLYDMTISAPKSVSVMALVGGDARLLAAHDRAVEETLKELESYAAARVRAGGANENRTTGNLVMAVYRHDASRELDPQLHTHVVCANLTYDGAEDRWKALQAAGIYERRSYLTEVYRNRLAFEVRRLGYAIESGWDRKGRDWKFEIQGLPEELLDKYSRRSQQRDHASRAFEREHGRRPTDNEVAVLVRETRAAKLHEISTDAVRRQQQERLTAQERQAIHGALRNSLERRQGAELRPDADAALDHARDHLFERVSVAHDHELLAEALRHGRGAVQLPALRGALQGRERHGELLRGGTEIATRESLERERAMIAALEHGAGRYARLGGSAAFQVSDHLREEQKQAVAFVLDSRDLAVSIRGAAGTGKTALLEELQRGLEAGRRPVLAVAPTMSAVDELRKVGFSDALTVERLLQDPHAQARLHQRALIVDEAGMISGRQMADLLRLAQAQSARLVFSGDTRQIQSVEASDALRILEKESRLRSVSLLQVQRQTDPAYRSAVEELRRHPERGFERLEQMGAVVEAGPEQRARRVAQAFTEAQQPAKAGERERSVLVVCATHEEIGRVTRAVREERKRAGHLRDEVETARHVPLNWTEAQKRDFRQYRPGLVLEFHRAVKGVAKNEALEVLRVDAQQVIARNQQGQERVLSARQTRAFGVFEKRSLALAPGDRLLLTANRQERGFRATNGELVTVRQVDGQGRIHLEDGRRLPAGYRQFDYGYAITAHLSQGKTVDRVIVSADRMKRELFYVAASRGREGLTVVTSNREELRESIGLSGTRQSAIELMQKAQAQTLPGDVRGQYRAAIAAAAQAKGLDRATDPHRNTRAIERQPRQGKEMDQEQEMGGHAL